MCVYTDCTGLTIPHNGLVGVMLSLRTAQDFIPPRLPSRRITVICVCVCVCVHQGTQTQAAETEMMMGDSLSVSIAVIIESVSGCYSLALHCKLNTVDCTAVAVARHSSYDFCASTLLVRVNSLTRHFQRFSFEQRKWSEPNV